MFQNVVKFQYSIIIVNRRQIMPQEDAAVQWKYLVSAPALF
jgi:hypothetical protein